MIGVRRGDKEQVFHLSVAVTFLIWIAASLEESFWDIYAVLLYLGSKNMELSCKCVNMCSFLQHLVPCDLFFS